MILDIPLEAFAYEMRVPVDRWGDGKWHSGGLVVESNPETGVRFLYEDACCADTSGCVIGRSITLVMRVEADD